MIKHKRILAIERTAILLLWIVTFISPLLFVDEFDDNWIAVQVLWTELAIILLAFLVNRFILMPRFFFKKRYVRYVISGGILLSLIGVFIFYFDGVNWILSLFKGESPEMIMPMQHGGGGGIAPPHSAPPHSAPPHHGTLPPRPDMPQSVRVFPPNISAFILLIIVLLLDLGLAIAIKWLISEQREAEANRERVTAQLSNLQNQVSPHFFMNTLNNIHALIEIEPRRAQDTIIELSELMGYLLYESSNMDRVLLQREIDFTESYVNLMRLRYPKRVAIDFRYDSEIPQIKIPPLLFLNFIENCFKYGIDYSSESYIKIAFSYTDTEIKMITENSNHSDIVKNNRHGLGITNSRKRLNLLYGDKFTLDIINSENKFFVTLKIPIE
ncbi:MAG: sensor histidine kinase [Bacteroidales bacterium]